MHFAAGIWLIALAVPLLMWLAVKVADRRARQRAAELLGERAARHREDWNPRVRGWQRFLYLAGIFWLVVALARPQWGASEVTVTQRGRDVVIALDVSNSMLAEDVTPNRLERAKAELTTFLRRQTDSRVGLVLFAGAAFVQCPLTADYGTSEIFLQMADPDMISSQGTALASALEVSRDLLISGRPEGGGNDFQAILLVTDGEDLEGEWEEEARECRREGITVIPVGIGEETGGLIPVTDDQGQPAGFLKDDEGQLVLSRIDLASLEQLAAIGGGSTFRVGLDGLAGERLRGVLERLGSRDFEQRQVTRWQERYPWFLALSLASLGLALVVRSRRPRHGTAVAALLLLLLSQPAGAQVLRPAWADNVERGQEAYAAGDYETALQEFETARAQAPDDPRLSLAVGETLFRLERHEEADREFTRARQLTDRSDLRAESLFNAGTNALAQGDAGQAIELLRESLRLEPDRPDALHNLESALLMQQQQQQQQQENQDEQENQENNEDEQEQENQENQDQQQQQQDQQQQDEQQQDQQQQDQPQDDQQQQDEQPQDQQDQQEQQEQPSQEELDKEQALQLLKALDRDEQELKRSVQRRLRGGGTQSGKRW